MEELMDGEITSLLQENCMTVFVSPLKNPGASCRVVEYVACLMSLPFVVGCIGPDELERIQRVYLDVRVVPNLVYAVKLLVSERSCTTDTDISTSTTNRWKTAYALSVDELQVRVRLFIYLYCLPAGNADQSFYINDGYKLTKTA